jgi:hypothetical protein
VLGHVVLFGASKLTRNFLNVYTLYVCWQMNLEKDIK